MKDIKHPLVLFPWLFPKNNSEKPKLDMLTMDLLGFSPPFFHLDILVHLMWNIHF